MAKPAKTSSKLQAVLSSLTGLKPEELKAVQEHCALLHGVLNNQRAAPAAASDALDRSQVDWLLEGIFSALRKKGLGATIPSWSGLAAVKTYNFYVANSPAVRRVYEQAIPRMTVAEKLALGTVIGGTYCSYVSEKWRTNALQQLFSRIQCLPEAVEDAFPNYTDSGMLAVLLKGRAASLLKETAQ